VTVPDADAITVQVPFSKTEIQVPREIWLACRVMEDRVALYAAAVLVAVFIVGISITGLMQGAGLGFVVLGWLYFDGLLARRCAVGKVRLLK